MTALEKKYMKIYPNIPLGVREEIVAIVAEQPLTWYQIYQLIQEKNPMAILALKQMRGGYRLTRDMKVTDLKDKNGREISKGDLVRFPLHECGVKVKDLKHFSNGIVFWDKEVKRWAVGDHTGWWDLKGFNKYCEVILFN